ncbi:hypothetical protein DFH08DRAFT_671327, partial [Mycena albidolilacea]
ENMAAAVWDTVQNFGIAGRITAFVVDNATNNDTMVEAFERRCHEKDIPFLCRDARMRCMPHTIHLSALKLLEAIGMLTKEETKKSKSRDTVYQDAATESLSDECENGAAQMDDGEPEPERTPPTSGVRLAIFKLRKIVRHVRSSPQRRKTWKKRKTSATGTRVLDLDKEQVLMLILDVKT